MADEEEKPDQESLEDNKLKLQRLKDEIYKVWNTVGQTGFKAAGISPEFIDIIFSILNDESSLQLLSEDSAAASLESKKPLNHTKWEELFSVALKSCSQILQLLVLADLHECKVDSPSILKRLMEVIKTRSSSRVNNLTFIFNILDTLLQLLAEDSTNILQAILIGVGCYEYLISGFSALTNNNEEQNKLFTSCTRAIATITYGSPASKEVFKASVGYDKLVGFFKNLQDPSDDFVFALMDWVVEGDYRGGDLAINNVDVILMMLDWLQSTNVHIQRLATEHLRRLCHLSTRNGMLCSVNRVFGKIINILDSSHQSIDESWADSLIKVLEELGSFSVSASELKQMISLFRPSHTGTKVKYTHHLLQALLKVSCSGSKKRAQYYFDLQNKFAGISVSSIQKWVGSGFTFFTWLCLEPEAKETNKLEELHRPDCRRRLYSFFSGSGIGVEAFLSRDKELVVATSTKKEYYTVKVPATNLVDGHWHSVSIAHLPSRRPFGQSTVCVCIDGVAKVTCALKFPSLSSEELSLCYIGSGAKLITHHGHSHHPPSTKTTKFPFTRASSLDSPMMGSGQATVIPAGTQDFMWGEPTSLQGQLGPICIFNEGLVENYHQAWHNAGPNNLDIFQPPDASGTSQGSLYELSSKLVLYYHAKAVRDFVCYDLTPPQPTHTELHGRISGHQCVTWNIKDVIQTIGGVEIFLPLLEGIEYNEKEKKNSSTKDKLTTSLNSTKSEKSIGDHSGESSEAKNSITGTTNTIDAVSDHETGELSGTISGDPGDSNGKSLETSNATCHHGAGESSNATNQSISEDVRSLEFSNSTTDLDTEGSTELSQTFSNNLNEERQKSQRTGQSKIDVTSGGTGTGSHAIDPQESQTEEWTIIDPRTDINYLRREMTKYCETANSSDVSLFLYLILNVFKENESIDAILDQSISFIAHMLELCDARLLDVDVLKSLQAMIDCVTSPYLLNQIYKHVVFNFRIWSSCFFDVRVGHIQYLSTIIKDNSSLFKKSFGVQFFLGVIRMYYAGGHESLCNTAEAKRAGAVDITEDEVKAVRASLLGLVKFYLKDKPTLSEAKCLVQYLESVQDSGQVVEILDLMNSLCTRSSTNKLVKRLSEPSNVCVFINVLQNYKLENIREKVLKLMGAIVTSSKVPEVNKEAWRLQDVGLTPLTDVLESEATIPIVLGLLELGVVGLSEVKGVQVYGYYDVVLAVVKMVLSKDLQTKLLVSHMILRSLDASRQSHLDLAKEPAWYDYLLRLLTVTSRDQIPSNRESDEAVFVTDLVNTVLDILFRVMWRGVQGYDEEAWKDRGQVITAVSTIASTEIFLYPSRIIERSLLEMSLQAAVEDIQRSGQTGARETQNALMVMRLVEDFLFTSVSFTGQEIEDVHTWSVKLVQSVAQLLEVLNVWGEDDSEETTEWEEMAQIGGRILLGFISRQETEFCATASSKLSKLLKARTINSQVELCYVLGKLYNAFVDSRQKGTENFTFILPIIRLIVLKYREQLPLSIYIPSFTAPGETQFQEEFIKVAETEEFKALMRQQVIPAIRPYENQCSDSSVASGRFWMDCLNGLTSSLQKRDTSSKTSSAKYQEAIILEAGKVLEQQREHETSLILEKNQQRAVTSRDWLMCKRKLTSERAAWASRSSEEMRWKLSTSENFQRMRLKLCRNYNFTNHLDASQKRDNEGLNNVDGDESSVPVHVAKEALVQGSEDTTDFEDVVLPNNTASPPTSPQRKAPTFTEKVLLEVDADFITLMESLPGKLKVSTTHVYFSANKSKEMTTAAQEFAWALTELREVHLRRHNLRRTALEFFLADHTNYFINFSKKDRQSVYKSIMSLRPPNLYYIGARSPVELLKASGLTERWVRREMSTFEYLMQLNTIAGRTYNDLSQYPVFPWVLTDYKSKELNLNDPAVYRDLSKPLGALNSKRAEEVREKYNSFVDLNGTMQKFHYGTHYSNSAGVLFYLLRVEPFTTLHIKLQNEQFDLADRQFQDIPTQWNSLYYKDSDVRELIPEFFYFPEFLENLNRFDIGRLQNGTVVDHVVLPAWARTPEEFVYKHRKALESEYVSMNIHHWFDLIFGYKQRGKAAEDALNVFSYHTYEGAVDLDAITDPKKRESQEGMINNFGQTPTQLLTEPHPQRMTLQEATAYKNKALENAGTTRLLPNVFDVFDKLKAYFVEVTDIRDPLVFTAVPKVQARSLIHHGMPDTMVTISRRGVLGAQDWLPYSKTKSRPFTFELDPTLNSTKLRHSISAPFVPDLTITCKLFSISSDARLIFTGGHWDSTIRVFTPKGKMISRIMAHSDVVTCLSLDNDGRHLVTGSRDTTCRIWSVTHQDGWASDLGKTPLQTLYGHDREITCVAISWEMDLVVSGAEDGTCIIHTARKGEYVQSLRPLDTEQASTPGPYRISSLSISEYGNIVLFCYGREHRALCRYSINGRLLDDERTLKDDVTAMTVCGEYVVTGGSGGRLSIRELHGLKEVKSIKLRTTITSISLAKDNSHIFVPLIDGKLIIIGVNTT